MNETKVLPGERRSLMHNFRGSWPLCGGLVLVGLLAAGCGLRASPVQMYEGPVLPQEQVGVVRSACQTEPGLTIMIVRIDDKDVPNVCADFALLPGEHTLELSAKRLGPSIETPMIRSGSVLGAPPSPSGAGSSEELPVVWASTSPLRITCNIQAGQEVTIVGHVGTGQDWDAQCQKRK
ncbi:MAG TPA: hypothetical protein VG453_03750 [Nitrospira sp.]|nr:hypothetical protein [Nitrospira sp.]